MFNMMIWEYSYPLCFGIRHKHIFNLIWSRALESAEGQSLPTDFWPHVVLLFF